MKYWYALGLALVLWGCPALPPTHAYQEQATRIDRVLDATVALVDSTGRTFCSGVLVEQQVLTAAHCIEGLKGAVQEVAFRTDHTGSAWLRTYDYVVAFEDDGQDMAILAPLDPNPPWGSTEVALGAPVYGDKVVVVGHPLGLLWTLSEGRVSHPRRSMGEMLWMQMTAAVSPGNSGGPVFNSYSELVGIVSFRMGGIQGVEPHLAGAVHWESIQASLGRD